MRMANSITNLSPKIRQFFALSITIWVIPWEGVHFIRLFLWLFYLFYQNKIVSILNFFKSSLYLR